MMILIRKMTAADLPRVHELEELCFAAPWPMRAFEHELNQSEVSRQWVAELGPDAKTPGLIVGAIVSWLVADEVHIATLSVDPAYRRQKIATRLICTALEEGLGKGAISSTLEVRAGNAAAQRLYARLGYQVVGRRGGYYQDNGEDAMLLTLNDLDQDHLNLIGCKKLMEQG
jgi:ribosomal-protein-alanine N-acetyltransferase